MRRALCLLCLLLGCGAAAAKKAPKGAKKLTKDEVQAYELFNLGVERRGYNDLAGAAKYYRKALQFKPDLVEARINLGVVLGDLGQTDAAFSTFADALEYVQDTKLHADILSNTGHLYLGMAERDSKHLADSERFFTMAVNVMPTHVSSHYNLGVSYTERGMYRAARSSYERVLELSPGHTQARLNLANTYYFLEQDIGETIKHFDMALDDPELDRDTKRMIYINKSQMLQRFRGDPLSAMEAAEEALFLEPEDVHVITIISAIRRNMCDWEGYEERQQDMIVTCLKDVAKGGTLLATPYDFTLIPHAGDALLGVVSEAASRRFRGVAQYDHRRAAAAGPLKIAYLSCDFRNHAMGQLTRGMILHQDRRQAAVDVSLFSYGVHDGSEERKDFESVAGFNEIRTLGDDAAAARIAAKETHIVIDLMAWTTHSRTAILGRKPAPILVNYLGYPGTFGSNVVDYALVDAVVAPPEGVAAWSEKLAYLPHTYQANMYPMDVPICASAAACRRKLEQDVQDHPGSRDVFSKASFLMCNFNNVDKVEPVVYRTWLNFMQRHREAVLLLLSQKGKAQNVVRANLHDEAAAGGVHPGRIIFMERNDWKPHLERIGGCDIFLDTYAYGAHTTAADALWAGIPLLTLNGYSAGKVASGPSATPAHGPMSSKVGASLLKALDDDLASVLVASSVKELESAFELLKGPSASEGMVKRLRPYIANQLLRGALYDSKGKARDVTRALQAMWEVRAQTAGETWYISTDAVGTTGWGETVQETVTDAENVAQQVLGMGNSTEALGVAGSALRSLSRVTTALPEEHGAAHLLGVMHHLAGQYGDAERVLRAAIAQHAAEPTYFANLATALHIQGKTREAVEALVLSVELDGTRVGDIDRVLQWIHVAGTYDALPRILSIVCSNAEFGVPVVGGVLDVDSLAHAAQLPPVDSTEYRPRVGGAALDQARCEVFELLAKAYIFSAEAQDPKSVTDFKIAIGLSAFAASRCAGVALASLLSVRMTADRRLGQEHASLAASLEYVRVLHALGAPSQTDLQLVADTVAKRPASRTVAIYCNEYGQTHWPGWGPSSLKTSGLGGSEEAVVFVSRALASLGWWVEVYNEALPHDLGRDAAAPGPGAVHYLPHGAYDASRPADVFVAWRYPMSVALASTSKVFVYLQDVIPDTGFFGRFVDARIFGVLFPSDYHRRTFPRLPAAKGYVTENALTPEQFTDGANLPHRFIYASSPVRGLETVLNAWPQIRQEIPEAELHVYYGFTDGVRTTFANQHGLPAYGAWKAKMEGLLAQPGVAYHGMVSHADLAAAYAAAGFFLYPTTYSETGCIALLKAEAMGAIPITSRYPASVVPEIAGAWDLGPEDALTAPAEQDPAWVQRWVSAVVDASRRAQRGELDDHRARMKAHVREKYTWLNTARKWVEAFEA